LPVVTTNAGGIPYFVRDGENGLVVEMKDYRALAEAVMRVVLDGDLRRRLIAGGRRTARECSWDAVKIKWAEIYSSLVTTDE
jgi:glycosyltransferase involved in cell wall biosynthesis